MKFCRAVGLNGVSLSHKHMRVHISHFSVVGMPAAGMEILLLILYCYIYHFPETVVQITFHEILHASSAMRPLSLKAMG